MSLKKRSSNESEDSSGKKLKRTIDDASDELICPITLKLPFHPVIAEDGRIYEREAIEHWFKAGVLKGNCIKSPVTNLTMGSNLVEATQVKNLIELMVTSGAVEKEKASDWTEQLAERDIFIKWKENVEQNEDIESMTQIGDAFRKGSHGNRKCLLNAMKWFLKAAKFGNQDAGLELRRIQMEISPDQYLPRQPLVTSEMRAILIDWLVEVTFLLRFKQETLHLTVYLVDKFGSTEMMAREKLQLIGVAALRLACKSKKETNIPDVHYLAHLTANAYSTFQIETMEELLIRNFNVPVNIPTCNDFLLENFNHYELPLNSIMKYRANYFLEQFMLSHHFLNYLPSVMASASVFLATCPAYAFYLQEIQKTSSSSSSSSSNEFNDVDNTDDHHIECLRRSKRISSSFKKKETVKQRWKNSIFTPSSSSSSMKNRELQDKLQDDILQVDIFQSDYSVEIPKRSFIQEDLAYVNTVHLQSQRKSVSKKKKSVSFNLTKGDEYEDDVFDSDDDDESDSESDDAQDKDYEENDFEFDDINNVCHNCYQEELKMNRQTNGNNNKCVIEKQKRIEQNELFDLVISGWIQLQAKNDSELFGHQSSEVITCAIEMAKQICSRPCTTPQGRVLDSVIKKYGDASMKYVSTHPVHIFILATSKQQSNESEEDHDLKRLFPQSHHIHPPPPSSYSYSSSSSSSSSRRSSCHITRPSRRVTSHPSSLDPQTPSSSSSPLSSSSLLSSRTSTTTSSSLPLPSSSSSSSSNSFHNESQQIHHRFIHQSENSSVSTMGMTQPIRPSNGSNSSNTTSNLSTTTTSSSSSHINHHSEANHSLPVSSEDMAISESSNNNYVNIHLSIPSSPPPLSRSSNDRQHNFTQRQRRLPIRSN